MPKKDYIEREITLVGRTKPNDEGDKACPVCKEADDFLSSVVKHDNRVKYTKIEVDSDEGQKIAEDEDIDNIPYIKDCKTFEKGGKQKCREIEGYSEDDWSDLSKLVPAEPPEEKKEEPKEVDKETGIKEPEEPEEPKPEVSEPL